MSHMGHYDGTTYSTQCIVADVLITYVPEQTLQGGTLDVQRDPLQRAARGQLHDGVAVHQRLQQRVQYLCIGSINKLVF